VPPSCKLGEPNKPLTAQPLAAMVTMELANPLFISGFRGPWEQF